MMKTKGEIKTSILMSKDVNIKKCKDLEGYKAVSYTHLQRGA